MLHRRMSGPIALVVLLALLSCEGEAGPTGPEGPEGPQGPTGMIGVSGWEIVSRDSTVAGGNSQTVMEVECPAGKTVLGGGVSVLSPEPQFAYVYRSFPSASGAWTVGVHNTFVDPQTLTAYAVCANVE